MRIGFTCGTFDLFHAGHILMLKEAKSVCDFLVVGIQVDPTLNRPKKHKPIQSLFERQIQVRACRYVDTTLAYETEEDLENILLTKLINIRIIGADWQNKPITGEDICRERGIEIYYNKRSHNFSTSQLIQRIKNT